MFFAPRLISAALLAAVGLAATAQETATFSSHQINEASFVVAPASSGSRAEVQAQTLAAMRAGGLSRGERSYVVVARTGSTLTRAQVRAEAREANRLGLNRWHEAYPGELTAEQSEQIRLAGLRAIAGDYRSASR